MIEAVIFDVDGTLVDSVNLHARAWIEAFRDYGIAIKFEDMRRQIGKGGDQNVEMFLSDQQDAVTSVRHLPRPQLCRGMQIAGKVEECFPESFGPVAMPPDFLQLQAVPKDFASVDLGVHQSQLRDWVKKFAEDPQYAFPGNGQMKPEQLEIARLKREVMKLKAERDILKKAAAYFAKEST